MDRRSFFKHFGFLAAMAGLGGKALAQEAKPETVQPVDKKRLPNADEVKLTFIGTSHGRVTTTRAHSCTLLQTGGKNYVIDAGEGAVANIMKSGTHVSDINAIFITHPHLDHYGGLYGLQQQISSFRKLFKEGNPRMTATYDILLPSNDLLQIMKDIKTAHHHGVYPKWHHFQVFKEGQIFDDGNVKVTAYGNDHMSRLPDGTPVAFSFLFECANGKRIFFSGDLHKSFDLPLEGIKKNGVDLLVCELVHYPIKLAVERLKDLPVKKTCFQHHGDAWEAKGWEERFAKFSSQLTMPSEIMTDGDVRFV